MSIPTNVKLSLQSLSENKIQEISFDGRETFIKPLSLSENLTDLANRIDFLNVDEDASAHDEEWTNINSTKTWDGIRSHLHHALIEMNVLVDVMSIAQNKQNINVPKDGGGENPDANRYLMYDIAVKDSEQFKPSYQMLTKKKALSAAAKILCNGADRLEKASNDASSQANFHLELLNLRKRWRLRRVGEKIFGDLSYKTVGSDFWHNGAFEVMKKSPEDDDDGDENDGSKTMLMQPFPKSQIKVIVRSDLQGDASIFVSIVTLPNKNKHLTGESCSLSYFDVVRNSLSSPADPVWHKKLCNAQNVLFCRELFMLLTKEAIQYKSSGMVSPFVVVGDVISTLIFSDTKLVVKLMYSKKVKQSSDVEDDPRFFSLKQALLQLLQAYHSRRLNVSPPKPVTAVLGLKDAMRKAAVQAWPDKQLTASYRQENEPLADSLLKMAKHYEVRRRLGEVLDALIARFSDPNIQAHWSMVSNMYESSVRVSFSNIGFESCYRSVVQVTTLCTEVKAISKDGTVTYLSVDKNSLYNFFMSLICTHQLFSVQALARVIGWTVLQLSPHTGAGISSTLLSRGTLLVASPSNDKCVSVACSIDRKGKLSYEVNLQFAKMAATKLDFGVKIGSTLALESVDCPPIRGDWHMVDWANCHGKYFLEKMATILTCTIKS